MKKKKFEMDSEYFDVLLHRELACSAYVLSKKNNNTTLDFGKVEWAWRCMKSMPFTNMNTVYLEH